MKTHFNCAVIGDRHLAFVTAACLAKLENKVVLVNPNTDLPWKKFPTLNENDLNEPGLAPMVEEERLRGNLDFSNITEGENSEWSADVIWLAVNTSGDRDQLNMDRILRIAQYVKTFHFETVFAVGTRVPHGFCKQLEELVGPQVVYVPEKLTFGDGIKSFLKAKHTTVGSNSKNALEKVKFLLKGMETEFLFTDLVTAESKSGVSVTV